MKNLTYGSASVLVSDAAASAVLHYAAILAQSGGGDVVDIPTSDGDGFAARASVILGPGIAVMATAATEDAMEDEDRAFVEEITGRAGAVLHAGPTREGSRGGASGT